MKKIILAAAATLALSTAVATAQTGTPAAPNTQRGPAQEGGRTQASPGVSPGGESMGDTTGAPTPRSGQSSQAPQKSGAQEGGRQQATPGGSGGTSGVDTTGTVTPRSGIAPAPNTQKGPAQEGGRTQATPGATQ